MGVAVLLAAALTITVQPQGPSGPEHTWTLRCGPAGGTLPQAAAACRKLAALEAPFAPTPSDAVCTQIYGGPQEAIVRGTFNGRRIWVRLTRRDGCAIKRWDRVGFLFR